MRREEREKQKSLNMLCEVYLFVKIGRPIAKWLARHTKMQPNTATLMNLLFVLIAVPFFLTNSYMTIVMGGILVYISGLWDTIDGNLARYLNMESNKGVWFEGIIDRVGEILILSSIGLGLYLTNPSSLIVIITIRAIFMQFLFYYANTSFEALCKRSSVRKNESFFTYCRALFIFIILIGALINQLFLVLLGFATVGNLYSALVQRSHWQKFKEMRI